MTLYTLSGLGSAVISKVPVDDRKVITVKGKKVSDKAARRRWV